MKLPVADGHCDFLYGAVQYGYRLGQPQKGQSIQLTHMLEGGVAFQFFACWIDTQLRVGALHQCVAMIQAYYDTLAQNPQLEPLTNAFDPKKGKIACMLHVEGGEAIEGSLAVLHMLYRMGVRAMTLTWNENNELAGAAMDRGNKGLTTLGKEVIDEMNTLHMAIDLSHLSDHGIDDILSRTNAPVFASHSNARAICNAPRCLTDAHIREIARRGGTVGVNFYPKQLNGQSDAHISDIVCHILHVLEVGGEDCAAIGSDFDGMQHYPKNMESSRNFPQLEGALLEAGVSETVLRKICYENLTRYAKQFV